MYVAVMCLECYVVGYMKLIAEKYTGNVPLWTRWVIKLSLVHTVFTKGKTSTNTETGEGHKEPIIVDGIELSDDMKGGKDQDQQRFDNSSTSNGLDEAITTRARATEAEFGWNRVARSFDRILRVLIPLSYFLCCVVMFASA